MGRRRRAARWVGVGAVALLAIVGGAVWAQMHAAADPTGVSTASIGVNGVAVAVDRRAGRVLVASSGIGECHSPTSCSISGGGLSMLDAHSGALVRTTMAGDAPVAVAVDASTGHVFVVADRIDSAGHPAGRTVSMLDVHTGRILRTVAVNEGGAASIAVDERRGLVMAGAGSRIAVLDAHSGVLLRTVGVGARGMPVEVQAIDGRTGMVFAAGAPYVDKAGRYHTPNTFFAVDAARGIVRYTVTLPGAPQGAALDSRTGHLFVALQGARPVGSMDNPGMVAMLSAANGHVLRTVPAGKTPMTITVATRSGRVFVVNRGPFGGDDRPTGPGSVTVIDARSGHVVNTGTLGLYPVAAVVDEGAGRVLVTTIGALDRQSGSPVGAGLVQVLDARTGRLLRSMATGVGPYHVAVDESLHRAFVVNVDGDRPATTRPWWMQWQRQDVPHSTVSMLDVR